MRAATAIDNARLYDAMSKAKADALLRSAELHLVQEAAKVASWSYDVGPSCLRFRVHPPLNFWASLARWRRLALLSSLR